MKTLKGWITTTVLMMTLMVSTTFADGGILIAGKNQPTPEPCTQPQKVDEKVNSGILIGGIGILIANLTGILLGGATEEQPVDCGILIGG